MHPITFALLAVVGCNSGLEGIWTGELTCTEGSNPVSVGVTMDLEDDGGGTYAGEVSVTYGEELVGEVTDMDCGYDVALEVDRGGGSQDFDFEGECTGCEIPSGDPVETDACVTGRMTIFDEAEWDGEDVITVEIYQCEGDITRS